MSISEHPDGSVLARDETNPRPYGRNPYAAYDQRTAPVAGFYSGEPDAALAPFARVVGIEIGGEALAIPTRSLAERGVVPVDFAGRRLSVWHLPGATSALGDRDIAGGDDIGSTAVFVAEVDSTHAAFDRSGDLFVDDITGSGWNVLGEAVEGPLRGERLDPIVHVDTFWFAWSTFHVDGALYDPSGAG